MLKHSKKITTRLKGNHYAIIRKAHGRRLVIIVTRVRDGTFILRTTRDCNVKNKAKRQDLGKLQRTRIERSKLMSEKLEEPERLHSKKVEREEEWSIIEIEDVKSKLILVEERLLKTCLN